MNFEFSDDQLVMKEEVRKLFEKEDTVKRNRNILEGDENFDKDLWNKVVEMGLTAVTIPEEHGGIGLGFLELCVVCLLYTSPSPRDLSTSRMPSSA